MSSPIAELLAPWKVNARRLGVSDVRLAIIDPIPMSTALCSMDISPQ